jgi:hypothetical protein
MKLKWNQQIPIQTSFITMRDMREICVVFAMYMNDEINGKAFTQQQIIVISVCESVCQLFESIYINE